jgi:murein DD-endopeptidase MepM/ murein hydrolase activator NlpD
MRHLRDWITPVPHPLGGDGRWHSGHHLSGREPASPRYNPAVNGRCHVGLDIAGEQGSEILAPDDGQITDLGYNTGAGNWITSQHQVRWGVGVLTVWARQLHCLPVKLVSVGQTVFQGQPIALLGNTGSSISPHDHTMIMLTPTLPPWQDLSFFLDPEPIYYQGRAEYMQQGHPYPPDVKKLQKRLNQIGCVPSLTVDGEYGPATVNAVRAFQSKQQIEPTGAAGELTLALLFATRPGKDI